MTDEGRKAIREYMGWFGINHLDKIDGNFDLNDAGLCVQEMHKRGEWEEYIAFVEETPENRESLITWNQLIALLFSADNFFSAFVEWRKGK